MHKYMTARFAFCLTLFCILAASCTNEPISPGSANTAAAAKRGGTLVYRLTSPPKTFNYLAADDEASVVASFFLLGSRLVDLDHKTQRYVPALAESWTIGPDGKTVDLKLRPDLKFSDGDDMTADDVAFTFAAVYDEKTNSPAFRDSLLVGGKKIEVNVIGPLALTLTFPEPVAAVENYLINLAVLPKHKLENDLANGTLAEAWKISSDPAAIVTSGPFTVESSAPGERTTLVRNQHYWKKDAAGTQLPYLDKLVLEIVADPNQTMARLGQNTLDIADRIRPADLAALKTANGPVKSHDAGPGLGVDYVWFNLNPNYSKNTWFRDKRFRQAVSAAIDRSSIASVTLQGLATPLFNFVSPANKIWSDPAPPQITYDLARAESLLSSAGFVKRGTPDAPELVDTAGSRVEFTLLVPVENESRKLMAAVIQEDLARLGIKMTVAPIEFQALTQKWTKSLDYDAILLGLSVTDLEPSSYANFLLSNAATHQWHPDQAKPATEWEARIDELFTRQARELDQQKRLEIFHEIQRIMADESPVVPIAARHVLSAAGPRAGNYSPSPIMPHSLWNADELYLAVQ